METLDLGTNTEDGCQTGVDWLLRLRELQRDGLSFDAALAQANAEFEGQ
jgi:hypothetical protein